ncbi:two-pore potassium channel 3-like [Gastrolobium bilobum]|uniref:two-pore potassium channel 3-like n=1 Tax=Gastrolobium bilobum TaxID=150636 RepID=UPI002AB04668|nr:two-pore potassium channel 3-like [Gastrolobium bilobum]
MTQSEKEPLLPYFSPRKMPPTPLHSQLFPLPENDEIHLPVTPSNFKDRLIFGPSSASPNDPSSPLVDALTLSLNSSIPSCSSSSSQDFASPLLDSQQQQHSSWLIDPNYPWHKKNLHRSKTAPAMAVISDFNPQSPERRPQFVSQSIIHQAVILLVIYLSLGVVIYWFNRHNFTAIETHPIVDALYFCIVTMCTIGYGDITPNSTATKLFSILFVLVGFGFIDILLSGMVSYVLDLQENHLLRTVKSRGEKDGKSYIIDVKKGRMRIRMKVALALGVVVLCIGVGVGVMHFVERLGWIDSFYLSVMSVTTVGYGDHAFKTLHGRIFAAIWLLVSTLAVARAFLFLAEARVDKRHRRMAKWILGQDMTVSEFLAADIDNNGFVSKSEYVIYKLKEMGKVTEKDIMQISEKFDRLDSGNCGKITLADLMEGR